MAEKITSASTDSAVSLKHGFLGDDLPLQSLSCYFQQYETLLARLPLELKNGSLRNSVEKLPELEFNANTLHSEQEWERAYLLLSFLGQSYIWMEGENSVVDKLPKKLAVPWVSVSKHLGMKPAGSYAATVLYNYGVKDQNLPWDSLDNLYALHTFTGSTDESHFYLIHVLMEMTSSPAMQAIAKMHNLMEMEDKESIIDSLKVIQKSMEKVRAAVDKMYQGCRQEIFYDDIRPYFSAKNKETIYEGTGYCTELHGASAAQSTGMYALSVLLGVEQSEISQKFMLTMIDYMPAKHRDFLVRLRQKPSFRTFCSEMGSSDLVASFNDVVEELVKFRNNHIILVTRYIVNQAGTKDAGGTGGAAQAVAMLKDLRDRTVEAKI